MISGNLERRHKVAKGFRLFCAAMTWASISVLAVLLYHVAREGLQWIDWQFLNDFPSRFPEKAGIKSSIYGTVWLITLTAAISIPVGVAAAGPEHARNLHDAARRFGHRRLRVRQHPDRPLAKAGAAAGRVCAVSGCSSQPLRARSAS